MNNAIAMLNQIVSCDEIFRIIVSYAFKWTIFTVLRFKVVHNRHGDLDIGIIRIVPTKDEVAFQFANSSDTDFISFGFGIDIDDILQCRTLIDSRIRV